MADPVILWFRQDLRLADQAALLAAAADGPVVPVYVLDDEGPGERRIGGAQRWWLYHSLEALAASLEEKGSRLIFRRGPAAEALASLARETGARRVHAIRHYEPWWVAAEDAVSAQLDLQLHDGNQLMPPDLVRTGSGGHFRIFTPFWRALSAMLPPHPPLPAPPAMAVPPRWPESERLNDWCLPPTRPDWARGFGDWQPGEEGARDALDLFADNAADYQQRRDLPAIEGTSRLSPHLHFGEISPATVWHALAGRGEGRESFRRELGWRDYATGVIARQADYGQYNGRAAFDDFPWRTDRAAHAEFRAWTRGETGYPIVDAGMRQLWATGWMHNRVRMIAASFLIKHLLIDWRHGERWFWDTLVDADYANNAVNWQWTAGTGIDSNMFVRIMAPLSQSEKFDAAAYIRKWVPELAGLGDKAIHDPEAAGARPETYPEKLIGHREARERALEAFKRIKA